MKRFAGLVLLGASLIMTACQKSKDSSSDEAQPPQEVVTNQSTQTLKALEGLWKIEAPVVSTNSSLPVAYALQINGDGLLSVIQFNRQTLASSTHPIGRLAALQPQDGEVEIDESAFLTWAATEIRELCGPANTQCIKDSQFRISDTLEKETPTWSLRDGLLNFGSLLSGLKARKASAGNIEKTRRAFEKSGLETRAVIRRQLALSPQSTQPLRRIVVQADGRTFPHLIGSKQTYACGGREVVIPEDITSVALNNAPQIQLNGQSNVALSFQALASSSAPTTFTFWNPFRCSERACSRVSVSFTEYEISLTEIIDGCATVISTYGN